MNLGRIICIVRGHAFIGWHTVTAAAYPDEASTPHRERRCKRCGKTEQRPLRTAYQRKRLANDADTIRKEA